MTMMATLSMHAFKILSSEYCTHLCNPHATSGVNGNIESAHTRVHAHAHMRVHTHAPFALPFHAT